MVRCVCGTYHGSMMASKGFRVQGSARGTACEARHMGRMQYMLPCGTADVTHDLCNSRRTQCAAQIEPSSRLEACSFCHLLGSHEITMLQFGCKGKATTKCTNQQQQLVNVVSCWHLAMDLSCTHSCTSCHQVPGLVSATENPIHAEQTCPL